MAEDVMFFRTAAEFRNWLAENHNKKRVQWVGYYKVRTGKPSMRWEESVRVALCFGWIDGLTKSIDEERYKVRFAPRKPGIEWSPQNIRMVEELISEGKMEPPGLTVYEKHKEDQTERASTNQDGVKLSREYLEQIQENELAWSFFKELPPSYLTSSIQWVMSAKRAETRLRRLKILIESSEKRILIPPLNYGNN